jgi:hypothetical protein
MTLFEIQRKQLGDNPSIHNFDYANRIARLIPCAAMRHQVEDEIDEIFDEPEVRSIFDADDNLIPPMPADLYEPPNYYRRLLDETVEALKL